MGESIEAMWTVWFQGMEGEGQGVVVLETGRVFGGDSGWYYRGNYEMDREQLKASIEVTHYGGPLLLVVGHPPGSEPFEIEITGHRISNSRILATGEVKGTGQKISFEMRRIAELP